jgi:trans-aconitate 2-methyltransferase
MAYWDVDLYARYGAERLRPSLDLMQKIPDHRFQRILDAGCGSGMSTAPLRSRWPEATIVGADSSQEMLTQARIAVSPVTWELRDLSEPFDDLEGFDLIFSNAFLQWLPDQKTFIARAADALSPNGILAIQIPDFDGMPASRCIEQTAASFVHILKDMDEESCHNYQLGDYYDVLSQHFEHIDAWETSYAHVMDDHEAIVEFIKSSALRPYLVRLDDGGRAVFLDMLLQHIEDAYPLQQDGKVLFPFKRMFFVAQK